MAVLTTQQLITNRLTPKLGYIQHIEAFMMLCQPTSVATRVLCPYGNWVNTPLVYKNSEVITPDSYDADAGTIDIASLVAGDDVRVTVTFKYFSNDDLTSFMRLALSRLNSAPPISYYTLDDSTAGTTATYPADTEFFLVEAAYREALVTLMMDLMGWRARIIFADPQGLSSFLQSTIGSIDSWIASILLTVKGRRNLTPRSVSAGRWKVPATVSDYNWSQYTVVRGS